MAREQRAYDKLLRVFRLETKTAVSVSEVCSRGQSVWAIFIPLCNRDRLHTELVSAGLTPEQVAYAFHELARTVRNCGFLIRIDHSQPKAGETQA
jgi:hypothetical protein